MARILVDNGGATDERPPRSGLVELVGGRTAQRLDVVQGEVFDAALRALVGCFELRALAVAVGPDPDHPNPGGDDPQPVSRLLMPPSWSTETGPGAQLQSYLEALLDRSGPALGSGSQLREIPIDGHRLWLQRTVEDGRVLVATAIREASLPSASAEALAAATRTLGASIADPSRDLAIRQAIAGGTLITLKSEGDDVLAEVNADWPQPEPNRSGRRGRRTGVGRGSEPVQAVARAAAKACRPRCEVVFAGIAPSGDGDVGVALIRHSTDGLRVGWAGRSRGDLGAVAEAVFTAAL